MNAKIISLAVVSLLVSACANKNCLRVHHESAVIQKNELLRPHTLKICKGGSRPSVVELELDAESTVIPLGSWDSNDRDSRYDGSCADNHLVRDLREQVAVALTADSFNQIKLCYYDKSKSRVALIEPNQPCPAETYEQEEPVDDCSKIL